MHDARRTNRGEPLPLEVRRILWQRVWDRLLAPVPTDAVSDHEVGGEPGTEAHRPTPAREGR